jgi:RNA polymerase subunit RPABC4/transcription elongation factor Spt4
MGEQVCPVCGVTLEPKDRVCPACGAPAPAAAEETAAFAPVAAPETAEEAGAVPTGSGPALVVSKGPDAGERFVLAGDIVTIGRDPASDIFLNDITVSRRHARIDRTDTGFVLSDVGSLNGTYVNGERIETHPLSGGDEVQIGKFRLRFSR